MKDLLSKEHYCYKIHQGNLDPFPLLRFFKNLNSPHYKYYVYTIHVKQTCAMLVEKFSTYARIKNCIISCDCSVHAFVCPFYKYRTNKDGFSQPQS